MSNFNIFLANYPQLCQTVNNLINNRNNNKDFGNYDFRIKKYIIYPQSKLHLYAYKTR